MNETPSDTCCPPPVADADLRPLAGPEADEELATLAKALGHPARVQILRLLVRKSACICGDIVDELPLAQSTVSQHLKVLKEAGLIRGEVDGPRVCYCIEPGALRRLRALVEGLGCADLPSRGEGREPGQPTSPVACDVPRPPGGQRPIQSNEGGA